MSLKVNTPVLGFIILNAGIPPREPSLCVPPRLLSSPWLRLRVCPVLSSLRISRAPGVTHAANTTNTSLWLWALGPAVTKLCRTLWFVGDRRITFTKHSDILHKMMIWSITWLDRNKIIDTPHVSGPGGVVLFIDWPPLCPASHRHCRRCKNRHCVGLYQAQRWRNWSVKESRPPLADSR